MKSQSSRYYEVLDTHVHIEAKQFPQNAFSSRMALIVKLYVPSLLFWLRVFQIRGLEDIVEQIGREITRLRLTGLISLGFVRNRVFWNLVPTLWKIEKK